MSKLKVAAVSLNQTPIDWKHNLSNIFDALGKAKLKSAKVVLMPELSLTGYGCQDLFFSDWIYSKTEELLQEIATKVESEYLIIGAPIRINSKNYNGQFVLHNKAILGCTLKQQLATDGIHYEQRWFTPWLSSKVEQINFAGFTFPVGDVLYNFDGIKTGIEICRDAWDEFNRPANNYIEQGAQLILNPSASHFSFGKTHRREQNGLNLKSNNNCAFVLVNLLGNESGRVIFDGDVQLFQNGALKYKADRLSFKDNQVHLLDIDFKNPDQTTQKTSSDSSDKNIEFSKASTLALFDYLRKVKAKGFVLSLSGGADSGLCAILVTQMIKYGVEELGLKEFCKKTGVSFDSISAKDAIKVLTKHFLFTVYQATKNSGDITFNAAKELAGEIGAKFSDWQIDDEVSTLSTKVEKALDRKLNWETDDIALQNIQARLRAPGVWMLANLTGKLLLTTSNRSEASAGYATMDGDTAGSLSPIAGVDKQFVRDYLVWAQKTLGYKSLSAINSQNSTAELRPKNKNQTDEDDLMPYPIFNEIEKLAIGQWKSPIETFEELNAKNIDSKSNLIKYISKFYKLWSYNQWKRERYAPSFHFDDYNVDPKTWCRFPIISGNFKEEIEQLSKL